MCDADVASASQRWLLLSPLHVPACVSFVCLTDGWARVFHICQSVTRVSEKKTHVCSMCMCVCVLCVCVMFLNSARWVAFSFAFSFRLCTCVVCVALMQLFA